MQIELTPAKAKKECPKEFDSVVAQMTKKGIQTNALSFIYSFCVRIDNSEPDMSSEDNYIKSQGSKYGISLQAKNGRKIANEFVKFLPDTFTQMLKDAYAEQNSEKLLQTTRQANLDGILKKVGKSGSCADTRPKMPAVSNGMDFFRSMHAHAMATQPVFPTLDDLQKAEPQIYQKYLAMGDGTKLVSFEPARLDCNDEWGFKVWNVICAYKPTKRKGDEIIRILITDDSHFHFPQCALYNEKINDTDSNLGFWVSAGGSDKAIAAKEGNDFKGWKNATYHKFTTSEISTLIQGRIFELHLDL